MRTGLAENGEGMAQEHVAKKFRVTASRISQIEHRAHAVLKMILLSMQDESPSG